jgi:hypothetical protein
MTLAGPSGRSLRSLALATDASTAGCVALTCRNATPWHPSPVRRPISGRSWHEAEPRGRPRSATCSPTYAIVATPVRTAIWRVSSLPGAAASHRRMGAMGYLPTRRRQESMQSRGESVGWGVGFPIAPHRCSVASEPTPGQQTPHGFACSRDQAAQRRRWDLPQ